MNKIKIIFSQTLMISTAILFMMGINSLINYLVYGTDYLNWPWYIPISYVIAGFLCALPTLLIMDTDEVSGTLFKVRIILHFICVGIVLSLCGVLFKWFDSLEGYLAIMITYVVIYIFVWAATSWILKSDEKKINEAIKGIQDEE